MPQSERTAHESAMENMTPPAATSAARPPIFVNSDDLISRPTRKRRNITPRSARSSPRPLGCTQPSRLGPMMTPARISPAIPGRLRFSNSSARTLAAPKTMSISSGRGMLSAHEFVGVSYEFGISAGTQLVKVHALMLAFDGHALRHETVEQQVQAIAEWQNKANQSGDTHHLGKKLARTASFEPSEQTDGQDAPESPDRVHGDGAARIVHFKPKVK